MGSSMISEVMVSIIVPVYNVEKYLARCIDSLLAQTMPNFELLLIDDGSKDRSGKMCDLFAEKDSRIRVFHQDNRGVSAARNRGLDIASGKYIYFADADDWVDLECLSKTVSAAESSGADLVIFGYRKHFDQSTKPETVFSDFDDGLYFDLPKALTFLHKNTLLFMLWNKLFRRNLITDLRFTDIIRLEDCHFVYGYLMKCDSLFFLKDELYVYVDYQAIVRRSLSKANIQNFSYFIVFPLYELGIDLYSKFSFINPNNPWNEIFKKRLDAHLLSSVAGDFWNHLPYLCGSWMARIRYIRMVTNKVNGLVSSYPQSGEGIADRLMLLFIRYRLPYLAFLLGIVRKIFI